MCAIAHRHQTSGIPWRQSTIPDEIICWRHCRAADFERLRPHLTLVPLTLGEALYESGIVLRHVYFPTDSIVSLLYVMADGASAEIAVVGNEGVIGVSLFMGGETTPSRAVVQSAGHGLSTDWPVAEGGVHPGRRMQHLLLRYTQSLLTQMAQTAVCNRHHSLDQQLCRWLLLSLDRLSSNELVMTQELIANMLGVRREGVTDAAGNLQKAGSDPVQSRPHHGAGSPRSGGAHLRMLCGGEEGIRPVAARSDCVSVSRNAECAAHP